MPRYIIWDSEDSRFEIEVVNRQPFLHIQVFKWNLSIAKAIQTRFDIVKNTLYLGGARHAFSIIPKENEKAIRFNKMYGLRFIRELNDTQLLFGCILHKPEQPQE